MAKKLTVESMASLLNIERNCRILDLGAGYGDAQAQSLTNSRILIAHNLGGIRGKVIIYC